MISESLFASIVAGLVSQAEAQLDQHGFASNRCLLSSTMLIEAINALPLNVVARRWEGSLIARNVSAAKTVTRLGKPAVVEAGIEANPTDLTEGDLGGHVAVLVSSPGWRTNLFLDPTIAQVRRTTSEHGWRCDTPEAPLIAGVNNSAEFWVEGRFPTDPFEKHPPLMRFVYKSEPLQMLLKIPEHVGWSDKDAFEQTLEFYVDGFVKTFIGSLPRTPT